MMNFERRLCPRLLKLKGVAIFAKTPELILPPEIEGARVAGHNKLCRINQSAEMTGGEAGGCGGGEENLIHDGEE